jgi:AmiR/NasT family two-component response regulator
VKCQLASREKPVVVVTSFTNADTLDILANLAVSAILNKPFTLQELISVVEAGLKCIPARVTA